MLPENMRGGLVIWELNAVNRASHLSPCRTKGPREKDSVGGLGGPWWPGEVLNDVSQGLLVHGSCNLKNRNSMGCSWGNDWDNRDKAGHRSNMKQLHLVQFGCVFSNGVEPPKDDRPSHLGGFFGHTQFISRFKSPAIWGFP